MSAWGKTGRVTLDGGDRTLPDVRVDDEWIGYLYTPDPNYEGWGARHAATGRSADHLPTRDAAVLWVLRRVDPALWRQERGDVFRVQVGLAEFPMLRWHVHAPAGTRHGWNYGCEPEHWDSTSTWAEAIDCAHQRIMAVSR